MAKAKNKSKKSAKPTASARDSKLIVVVKPDARLPGTQAHKRFAEMAKLPANQRTVANARDKADYRPVDLRWDLERGFVRLK